MGMTLSKDEKEKEKKNILTQRGHTLPEVLIPTPKRKKRKGTTPPHTFKGELCYTRPYPVASVRRLEPDQNILGPVKLPCIT